MDNDRDAASSSVTHGGGPESSDSGLGAGGRRRDAALGPLLNDAVFLFHRMCLFITRSSRACTAIQNSTIARMKRISEAHERSGSTFRLNSGSPPTSTRHS